MCDSQPKSIHSWVTPAIVIGVVSAVCYASGYLVKVHDAAKVGIPLHLLPDRGVQATILTGAAYTLLLSVALTLVLLLGLLISRCVPEKRRSFANQWIKTKFYQHKNIYSLIGLLLICAAFLFIPIEWGMGPSSYSDDSLSDVLALELKNGPGSNLGEFKYLSRIDDMIVLKRKGTNQFLLLNITELRFIQIAKPK